MILIAAQKANTAVLGEKLDENTDATEQGTSALQKMATRLLIAGG